jgi:hypothetical protein
MTDSIGASVEAEQASDSPSNPETRERQRPVHPLLEGAECVLSNDGGAYVLIKQGQYTFAVRAGSKLFHAWIRDNARDNRHEPPRRAELNEIDYLVQAAAETRRQRKDIWLRVAPVEGGIEIDLGDDRFTRVRVTAEGVEEMAGSPTLFTRTPHMKPLVRPARVGNLQLLHPLLPKLEVHRLLVLAWITYTIAHPKIEQSKYVILVLTGGQGSGKTLLSKLTQRLIDPNVVGVQVMPKHANELAIATRNAHVVLFDNIRAFQHHIADALCIASTGGSITARQLYTNEDQNVIHLHGAVVVNGIYHFIDQPDLAQRCLHLHLPRREGAGLRSEEEIETSLARDLPEIMGGLYGLIANILRVLPTVKVDFPHRMYDFVRWLAAMEEVTKFPMLQEYFVRAQAEGQREALQENVLSAAVLEFAENVKADWEGTPSDLLRELGDKASDAVKRSRDWPLNPIALSRRLVPMQAALKEQKITLEFTRGKERKIKIVRDGAYE